MIWNGMTLTSNPPQYDHACNVCGNTGRTLGELFPRTVEVEKSSV
jgi:hypothetical protein